jgi:hypothetical protein
LGSARLVHVVRVEEDCQSWIGELPGLAWKDSLRWEADVGK